MLKLLRNHWFNQIGNALNFGLIFAVTTISYVHRLNGQQASAQTLNPKWWADREVVDETRDPQNSSVVNLGQLKWIASQLHEELETILPLGAGFELQKQTPGGPGYFDKAKLPGEAGYSEWADANYGVAVQGQGKNVALAFYNRLNSVSQQWVREQLVFTGIDGGTLDTEHQDEDGNYYPWTVSDTDDQSNTPLTIGQLKAMFALRVRSDNEADADGLPDLFEYALSGLSDLDYATYIGKPNDPAVQNPFAGLDIGDISASAGDLNVSFIGPEGDLIKTAARTPFPGLASANASVSALLSQHQSIGSVGGSFSVGGDGSATYSIPIDLPKGTSGMEPSIALGYSSSSGNGALGVGFDLSGFQRITRGSTSRAKEGTKGVDPVDFDENDRFFFGGELLIAVEGVYGANGTEYRTETDSFARIISWGQEGSGPRFWTVETKAGLRIEMGNCASSCVYTPGGRGVLVWNVNRVSDNVGNYYEVEYSHNDPAGPIGYRPQSVVYTGNEETDLSPYQKVIFDWEDRPDVTTGVINGVKVCNNKRLAGIRIGSWDQQNSSFDLLHRYQMTYGTSAHTKRSRLKQIQKHYPGAAPLPPTVFDWDSQTAAPLDLVDQPVSVKGRQRWISSENGDYNFPSFSSENGEIEYVKLIDLNGDGLLDRVTGVAPDAENKPDPRTYKNRDDRQLADYGVWVALNNGNGFEVAEKWFDPEVSTQFGSFGIVNVTTPYAAQASIKRDLATPTFGNHAGFIDVNGDGLLDRVQSFDFADDYAAIRPGGYLVRDDYKFAIQSGRYQTTQSFEQLISAYKPARGLMVALNSGSGFGPMEKWLSFADQQENEQSQLQWEHEGNIFSGFVDMNSDGILDRVDDRNRLPDGSVEYGLWVSLGKGFWDPATGSAFEPKQRWYFSPKSEQNRVTWAGDGGRDEYSILIDINSDGILDRVDHRNYDPGPEYGVYGLWVSLGKGEFENGSGFHAKQKWYSSSEAAQSRPKWREHSRFFDINGDGLPDRVNHCEYNPNRAGIWVCLNKGKFEGGSGFHPAQRWLEMPSFDEARFNHSDMSLGRTYGVFRDMNGDGLADRVQYFNTAVKPRGLYVALNKGFHDGSAGFEPFEKWYHSDEGDSFNYVQDEDDGGNRNVYVSLIDLNADGLPDRVLRRQHGQPNDGLYVALNRGKLDGTSGFYPEERWLDRSGAERPNQNQVRWLYKGRSYSDFVDINGDGFPDRLDHHNYDPDVPTDTSRNGLWVSLNTGTGFAGDGLANDGSTPPTFQTSEFIHSIQDGLKAEIRVQYKRLNDPSLSGGRPFYTRGEPTAAQLADERANRIIRAPGNRWAVFRYAEQDGLGDWRWMRNYFGGRKFDQVNEVDLGFRWVESIDEARGGGSISIFNQTFPFQGSPQESLTYVISGGQKVVLSREITNYAETVFNNTNSTGADPAETGGLVRFIYATSSTSEQYSFDTVNASYQAVTSAAIAECLPDCSFVGNKTSTTTINNLAYSEFGDLEQSVSTSSFAGQSTTVNNTFLPPTITSPSPDDLYDPAQDTVFPVPAEKLFGKWVLGRLSESSTTTSRDPGPYGDNTSTKTSRFTYYSETSGPHAHLFGMLRSEVMEPQNDKSLVSQTFYDEYGNTVGSFSYPGNGPTTNDLDALKALPVVRWVETEYDERGRFPISTKNQLDQTTASTYDEHRALLLSTTGVDGLTVSFLYDSYGTRVLTRNPDGTETAEITARVEPPMQAGPHTITHKRCAQTSGAPPVTTYLDAQGRSILTEKAGFGGKTISTLVEYNEIGQSIRQSLPFFTGDPVLWTDVFYDDAGRVCRTDSPDGGSTKVYHSGLESYLYNANDREVASGQKQTRILDPNGRLVETIDNLGGSVSFFYDVQGRLVRTEAPGGHVITADYDDFGNKTFMSDSDTGSETIVYNAFGDPETTSDDSGNSVVLSYDEAGRVKQRDTFKNGVFQSSATTTYLKNSKASDGLVDTVEIYWDHDESSHKVTNHYDRFGRAIGTTEVRTLRPDGSSTASLFTETFQTSVTLDALGRVVTSTNAGGLTTRTEYDEQGFQIALRNHYTGELYWEPLTYDASGRLLTERLGNGVVNTNTYDQTNGTLTGLESTNSSGTLLQNLSFEWDKIGNLLHRHDLRRSLTESFTYDGLNRLKTSTVGNVVDSVTYDAGGNIKTRTGLGTYVYDPVHKHQLKSLGDRNFIYDSNGSLTSETRGAANTPHRSITWGAHGKITEIQQHSSNTVQDTDGSQTYSQANTRIAFDYDAGINRIRKILTRTQGISTINVAVTDYFGSYERTRHRSLGNQSVLVTDRVEHRHHIGSLVLTTTEDAGASSPTTEKVYRLKDHLGSTSALLDVNGDLLVVNGKTQIFSYDSWGKRRDAETWLAYSDAGGTPVKSTKQTNRGYTGHEMLDEVGLVHMNGRIYDSDIGRFLSADPHVQAPENSQNYNRYAYVLNNPLSYTDPSGYFFKKLFKKIGKFFKSVGKFFKKVGKWIKENWRTLVSIAFAFVAAFAFVGIVGLGGGSFGTALGLTKVGAAAAAGAVSGAFNTAISGGNFGDILKGALVGGIAGAISAGVLHPMGTSATTFADKAAHAVSHGILGGARNVALGGKFADGFISGTAGAAIQRTGVNERLGIDQAGNPNAVVQRTIVAGVAGGTASALSGGKFANGAYTAAFQHLLNEEVAGLINLLDHENVLGGHTIREHVAKSRQTIRQRMNAKKIPGTRIKGYKGRHSSFRNLKEANSLVSRAINANKQKIQNFLNNKLIGGIVFTHTRWGNNPGKGTGYGYTRRGPTVKELRTGKLPPLRWVEDFTSVTVVLKKNPDMPAGYSVFTAFPAYSK